MEATKPIAVPRSGRAAYYNTTNTSATSNTHVSPRPEQNSTAYNVLNSQHPATITVEANQEPPASKRRVSRKLPNPRECVANGDTGGLARQQSSISSRIETASLGGGCDSMSMASKSSRSSRFMRGVSYRKSRAAAWLTAKLRKHQKSTDLSATFNLLDQEHKGVLVNLNCASEEELMTVSGITRVIARSIVEYRTAIGGFRQLQDLALVSGVGAAKMATLCKDLTIVDYCNQNDDRSPSPESRSITQPLSIASAPTPSPHYHRQLPVPPCSSQPTSQFASPQFPHCSSHPSTPVHKAASPTTSNASPLRRVNLNTASIFELMTVPGINQESAANIVHYRDKKGSFRCVDDVSRVRGMRHKLTRDLHSHLSVADHHTALNVGGRLAATNGAGTSAAAQPAATSGTCTSAAARPAATSGTGTSAAARPSVSNGDTGAGDTPDTSNVYAKQHRIRRLQGHRRTLSAPLQNNSNSALSAASNVAVEIALEDELFGKEFSHKPGHRLSIDFSSDVYELLSLRSERPEISEVFENSHSGRSAIRIATWNLCKLTPDKINNPGVMEVVCRTVLERGFSVLALQDILGSALIEKICKELNTGSLRRVREWPGRRGSWTFVQSKTPVASYTLCKYTNKKCYEYTGFLFNRRHVQLVDDCVLDFGVRHAYVGKPHVARFKSNKLNFVMANIHVKHQNLMYRSESFLQSSSELQDILAQSCIDNEIINNERISESSCYEDSLDTLKSSKNLQNGLIKESILGRDDLSQDGPRSRDASLDRHGLTNGDDESKTRLNNIGFGVNAEAVKEELIDVLHKFMEKTKPSKATVILGDFGVPRDSEGVSPLPAAGYHSLVGEETSTQMSCADGAENIWLGAAMLAANTGVCSVVKEGLSHLAIPRGWGWGGVATPHCPVYADLYTDVAVL